MTDNSSQLEGVTVRPPPPSAIECYDELDKTYCGCADQRCARFKQSGWLGAVDTALALTR
jgi:hypothetical protein